MAAIFDPSSQNRTLNPSLVISKTPEWKFSGQSLQENKKFIEFWVRDRNIEFAIYIFEVLLQNQQQ